MAKKSLKERLKEKKAELKSRGTGGNIVFLKDGDDLRVRILNMGEENEFIQEVTQFYLGGEIKGVISPETFGEPCAIYEEFQKLKTSKDPDDKDFSKKFNIRKRYLAYCIIYKDSKGKEVDPDSPKFVLLANSMYDKIIELYLDEDEWGNMTDLDKGYDLKLKRTGSGKMDTEYSVSPCKETPWPKAFRGKVFNLEEEVRKLMPTYEETKELLARFLGGSIPSDEEEDKPKKKKKIGKRVKKGKKKTDLE